MNHIIFCVGFILTFLIVYGTSSEYFVLSETKETVKAPFHFTFKLNYNLYLPIKLKNIPPSVTAIYFIYTSKKYFWSSDQKEERIKIDTEIKNGEVNLLFIRNVGRDNYNVLFDVQLETEDGICTKSRIAEGRIDDKSHCAQFTKYECWNTNWKKNNQKCTLPNLCDIVVDFNNRCAENLQCYYNATKYICVLNNENKKHYKLYQTYDSDVPKAKLPFRDYTYIDEVESCYKIHATPKNWDDAIKVCQSEGASLFYPVNSTEVNAVISFWQSNNKEIRYMYVGISDIETEGQFKTIDGTPIDEIYQKWIWNQPDNYLNNEHCLFMYPYGKYNDGPCSTPYSFICKKSLLSPERSIQHNLNTRNVITTEEPNSTKTSSSTVTILYSICGVGLTALVIVGIYWCWSTRRPQGTHGLPINQPTEPFYLNMLFRRQCDQEIAEIDQLYEEIDQHHTPGVVRG